MATVVDVIPQMRHDRFARKHMYIHIPAGDLNRLNSRHVDMRSEVRSAGSVAYIQGKGIIACYFAVNSFQSLISFSNEY